MGVPTRIADFCARNNVSSGIVSHAFTVQSGDVIVVASFAYETTFTSRLPSDSQGNSYTYRVGITTGTRRGGIFTAVCGASGSLTVTHDISATGNDLTMLAIQVRGVKADPFIDVTGTAIDQASSTSWSLNLSDTTTGDVLVIGIFGTIGAFGTFTPATNWTATAQVSADPGIAGCYRDAATPGTYDPAGTVASSQAYSAIGISLIGTAAAAAASLIILRRPMAAHLVR